MIIIFLGFVLKIFEKIKKYLSRDALFLVIIYEFLQFFVFFRQNTTWGKSHN